MLRVLEIEHIRKRFFFNVGLPQCAMDLSVPEHSLNYMRININDVFHLVGCQYPESLSNMAIRATTVVSRNELNFSLLYSSQLIITIPSTCGFSSSFAQVVCCLYLS